ncbi:fimbria/pilus chaperone family protein [Pseudomonas typographi]|uniref:Fimbria/pilus periplasmic chaperone n=1 Tax=Pseudomonas typographi TaxID=2715964 RepID=A0ABR7YWM3_9PSED|nr:fimbria/pilus chaperone family protein [Pseudomonas typographi]MBD1597582.1 fimbria/pilus periplasmic chaperone [Pseudomonas typographi]
MFCRLISRPPVAAVVLALCPISAAWAAGMQPETTVVLIHAGDGEGSLNVRNSDPQAALLHTVLEDLPEDTAELLIVTPPVARVEAGKSQLVRFILQPTEPIETQRMKRVIFEGIAPKNPDGSSRVNITVRHGLPVIIHPQGMPVKRDPWTQLQWSVEGGQLVGHNPSPYVVRLANQVMLLPGKQTIGLPSTYILPSQRITQPLPPGVPVVSAVRVYPASLYGFAVAPYEAALQPH